MVEGSALRGAQVLDIGSGLGAVGQLLVQVHGAGSVVGIDLEPDLIRQAHARIAAAQLADRIEFVQVSPGPLPLAAGRFDVVFSKDSLVQIPDKPAIFAEVLRVLVPGGWFLASDWLRGGSGDYSSEMLEYLRLEGITYNMVSIEATAAALGATGFVNVAVIDRNAWYRTLAELELARMRAEWFPLMVSRLGAARARHFVRNWTQLVLVLSRGELRPADIKAQKPSVR